MSEDLPPQKSESVKTTLFTPSLYGGRFTRKQYFLHLLVGNIIFLGFLFLLGTINAEPTITLCSTILATVLFFLPIAIKRGHDIGHNGICVAILMILSLFIITGSMSGDGLFLIADALFLMIVLIVSLMYGIILLIRDSEKGTNKYGPSSKYPDKVA